MKKVIKLTKEYNIGYKEGKLKGYLEGKKEVIKNIKKEFNRYELTNIAEILDYLNKL